MRAAGVELSAPARASMQQWDERNPPGKYGAHRYSLDAVGCGQDEVQAAFAEYQSRFGAWTGFVAST